MSKLVLHFERLKNTKIVRVQNENVKNLMGFFFFFFVESLRENIISDIYIDLIFHILINNNNNNNAVCLYSVI